MFFEAKLFLLIFIYAFIPSGRRAQPISSNISHLNKSSEDNKSILLCADGKGPLLEGEGNVLPCVGECPQGFDCELFSSGARTGICCPNLAELFRLYDTESNKDALPEVLEASGFSMESRDAAVQAHTQMQELHPDKSALSLIHTSGTDIRQRQPLGQSSSLAQLTAPASQLEPESFSCKRQYLKLYCEDGHRETQFVLRWFHRAGECLSYPWGYCPGQPVASDVTIRTKEECQLLCLPVVEQQQHHNKEHKLVGTPLSSRALDSVEREPEPADLARSLVAEGQKGLKEVKIAHPTTLGSWQLGASSSSSEEPIFPSDFKEEAIQQLSPLVLLSNKTAEERLKESRHLKELRNAQKSSEEEGSTRQAAIVLHEGNQDHKSQSKKRCEKISPYRAMCKNNGMPSQFTLRWHSNAGFCIAYPYGYCHGESVYEEEPIKTERECLEVCVKKHNN